MHESPEYSKTADFAAQLALKEDLSYKSQVNIEAAMNNLINLGISFDKAVEFVTDIVENIQYIWEIEDET